MKSGIKMKSAKQNSRKYVRPGIIIYLKPTGQRKHWEYRFKFRDEDGNLVEIRRSSKTPSFEVAKDRAYIDFKQQAGLDKSRKPIARTGMPSCQEIIDAYFKNILTEDGARLSPNSVRDNINCFTRFLKLSFEEEPVNIKVTALNEGSVREWRRRRYEMAGLEYGRDEDLRLNYSLNSEWNSIKSVFSITALKLYGRKFKDFDVSDFKRVRRLEQMDTRYDPIPAEVMEDITVFLFGTMIDDHLEWDARIML
jgi:hypothetical protein